MTTTTTAPQTVSQGYHVASGRLLIEGLRVRTLAQTDRFQPGVVGRVIRFLKDYGMAVIQPIDADGKDSGDVFLARPNEIIPVDPEDPCYTYEESAESPIVIGTPVVVLDPAGGHYLPEGRIGWVIAVDRTSGHGTDISLLALWDPETGRITNSAYARRFRRLSTSEIEGLASSFPWRIEDSTALVEAPEKFSRGTKIRVIGEHVFGSGTTAWAPAPIGTVGTVISGPDSDGDYFVNWAPQRFGAYIREGSVEKVTEEPAPEDVATTSSPAEEEYQALRDALARAETEAREARERLTAAIAEHERRIEEITKRAHQEAEDRGWCGEFDDIMDNLGLPRRERAYEVEYEVTVHVSVSVMATSEEDAEEMASEEITDEFVADQLRYNVSIHNVSHIDTLTV